MTTVKQDEFLRWCAEGRIEIHPRYAHNWPRNFWFKDDPVEGVFYTRGPQTAEIESLLKALLKCSDAEETFLWAKEPALRLGGPFDLSNDALAVPATHGAILIRHLVPHIQRAGTTHDDLYIIPDHRQHFLMIDHHDAIFVEFATQSEQQRFVAAMHHEGIDLPADLPDETFKRPGWMTEE